MTLRRLARSKTPFFRAPYPRMMRGATLFEKIWNAHVVKRFEDERDLVFVDRHILQETTCAAAFAGLKREGGASRIPELTLATQDHIVSTEPGRDERSNPGRRRAAAQLMRANAAAHGIRHFGARRSAPGHCPCHRP